MHSRTDALDVLYKLRDNLADRMSERILDSAEDLLDDAMGESYRGEIELLYEQFGAKLMLINQMIGSFPVDTHPPVMHSKDSSSDVIETGVFSELMLDEEAELLLSDESIESSLNSKPAENLTPSSNQHPEVRDNASDSKMLTPPVASLETTWGQFLRQIRCRDILAAGEAFSLMSSLPIERTELAASHFLMRVDQDAGFLEHAAQLVEDVRLASVNDALEILYGAFGLEGDDALTTLVAIRPFLARELSTSKDFWE